MHEYLVGLHENFSIFLEELDFKFVEFFHRGDLWSKGDFFVINDIHGNGKVTITTEYRWTTKKQFDIYKSIADSSTAVSIINEAKQYVANVVSMLYEPNRDEDLKDKVVDLCKKVINTPPDVDFSPSYVEGIAFCVFCGSDARVSDFENVRHKEYCEVLLAKEILKEYE